jgi:hypothetical protein
MVTTQVSLILLSHSTSHPHIDSGLDILVPDRGILGPDILVAVVVEEELQILEVRDAYRKDQVVEEDQAAFHMEREAGHIQGRLRAGRTH